MQVRLTSTVLLVADMERAKSMYRDVLEQEIVSESVQEVVFSSGFSLRPGADLPGLPGGAGGGEQSSSFMHLYFETDDIDEVTDRVFEAELKILHPVAESRRGRRFLRFLDPDSHLIEVGEEVAAVVRREAAYAVPAEMIAQKTGIPLARVLSILAGDTGPA